MLHLPLPKSISNQVKIVLTSAHSPLMKTGVCFAAALKVMAVLYFKNNSLIVVLESNEAIDLLWNSCPFLRKLTNSFSLLLSFRDFPANALPNNLSLQDALWQSETFRTFRILVKNFLI